MGLVFSLLASSAAVQGGLALSRVTGESDEDGNHAAGPLAVAPS